MNAKLYHTEMVSSIQMKKLILSLFSPSRCRCSALDEGPEESPVCGLDYNILSGVSPSSINARTFILPPRDPLTQKMFAVPGGVFAAKPSLKPFESVEKSQNDSLVVFCSTSATNELVTWADPKGKNILSTAGR